MTSCSNYVMHLACTINCILLAIMHTYMQVQLAAKTSIFSLFCRGLRGAQPLKRFTF